MVDKHAEQVIGRVMAARAALEEAAEAPDSPELREALDELESALRLARESGVEVPPVGDVPQSAGGAGN
ncbi:hypothetical protein [Actinacidiphila rubida]|uniref:Uncharacterized protein n=1 Tax=Actinacidiphila rubida TaxID=310780 RepID=A0A1H8NSX9_9ACTN|nr:hypothetical protein [Actinacidiphila rubida]SEO32737.1 hypothetical protein SAMN05216267_102379 [Actinacidiphila rubida]